jgi:hypothetical protein
MTTTSTASPVWLGRGLSPAQRRAEVTVRGARCVARAEDAVAGIRAVAEATGVGEPMPAPAVYDLAGSLRRVLDQLGAVFGQVGEGLCASLVAPDLYTVYEADTVCDPSVQACRARTQLAAAGRYARLAAECLDEAREAIAGQGYTVAPRPAVPADGGVG